MERIGAIGYDLNQKHMEKDMEIMVKKKSNLQTMIARDFEQVS